MLFLGKQPDMSRCLLIVVGRDKWWYSHASNKKAYWQPTRVDNVFDSSAHAMIDMKTHTHLSCKTKCAEEKKYVVKGDGTYWHNSLTFASQLPSSTRVFSQLPLALPLSSIPLSAQVFIFSHYVTITTALPICALWFSTRSAIIIIASVFFS